MERTLTESDCERLGAACRRAIDALISLQKPDGHWCGELQGDSILESEYVLMKFILGQERSPMADGRDGWRTLQRIANYLRSLQRPDGGWGQYPGSDVDLSATVKAYFALKLMGDSPAAPHMRRAYEAILSGGGAEHCNSFTNFYLACLGQISWSAVPAIPPELIYLPRWFYFHLSKVSAWTRAMILPLSLVVTLRPQREVPAHLGIDELFVDQRQRNTMKNKAGAPRNWSRFFVTVDWILKRLHDLGGTPIRRLAIKRAEQWILERCGQDGVSCTAGLGAIFPPMVYLQIAFMALGYRRDHEIIQRAERELDELFIEDEATDSIRIQPCFSPVWDTGIAQYALADCGLTDADDAVHRSSKWLLSKECRHIGDWAPNIKWNNAHRIKPRHGRSPSLRDVDAAPLGCWYFEYANAWYPDCDDTAMVAMALRRAGGPEEIEAGKRGVRWLLAMQNDDGGWAAFDKTRHRQILEYIPFADHNAMQDPSCPDITGRVLECLSWHGYRNTHPAVKRAVEYIRSQQVVVDDLQERHEGAEARRHERIRQTGGAWFGRWGVNYIYGTWQAVIGPIRCGEDPQQEWIQRAGRWIKAIQKPDGSFGESANSYVDPSLKGQGPSTASQTAWAAMILQEIYGPNDSDLRRAIEWLAGSQLNEQEARDPRKNPDRDPPGSWIELEFTGTGFPRVFYLRYHLYRLYFPLMAIGRYLTAHGVSLASTRDGQLMALHQSPASE
jgi:squalene-hopene/tetraprenyl-beta-curcumene cyclase